MIRINDCTHLHSLIHYLRLIISHVYQFTCLHFINHKPPGLLHSTVFTPLNSGQRSVQRLYFFRGKANNVNPEYKKM